MAFGAGSTGALFRARHNGEMRIHGNLAIAEGIHFGALKTPCAPGLEQMKMTPPDETQQGYSMTVKKGRRFIHRHQVSVPLRP